MWERARPRQFNEFIQLSRPRPLPQQKLTSSEQRERVGVLQQRGQRLQADLTLLAVAILWGSAFVVQRIAATEIGVFIYNGYMQDFTLSF